MTTQLLKKENLVIVIGEYNDKETQQPKKQYKTIGEILTWNTDGDQYQTFKQWGPGGVVEGKVFEQQENRAAQTMNQAPQQQPPYQQAPPPQNHDNYQPPQQTGYQQAPPQQGGYTQK